MKQHSKTLIDKCQFDMFYWYKYSYNNDNWWQKQEYKIAEHPTLQSSISISALSGPNSVSSSSVSTWTKCFCNLQKKTSTSNVLRAAQHRRLWNLCQCDLLFTQGAFNLNTDKSHWLYKFIILNIKLVLFGACIYLFVCPMKVCLELTVFDLVLFWTFL